MHTLGSVTTKRKYCKRKQLPSRRIQAMHFLAIISSFKSFIEGKRVSFQKRILFLFNWCVLPRKMYVNNELRKKCLYLEIFWSAFPPRIPPDPEYGEREREKWSIQCECRKISIRITSNTGTFHALLALDAKNLPAKTQADFVIIFCDGKILPRKNIKIYLKYHVNPLFDVPPKME